MAPSGAPAAAHPRHTSWVESTWRKAIRGPRRRPPVGRHRANVSVSAGSAAGSAAGGVQGMQPLESLAELGREVPLLVATGLLACDHLGRRSLPELRPRELGLEPLQLDVGLPELAGESPTLLGKVEDPGQRH